MAIGGIITSLGATPAEEMPIRCLKRSLELSLEFHFAYTSVQCPHGIYIGYVMEWGFIWWHYEGKTMIFR